jgi:tRNA modification GTPase
MLDDTIAAVATPPGRGGIGVIRLSGPNSVTIARAVIADAHAFDEPNRSIVTDFLVPGPASVPLDRIVVTFFRSPRSYTGEDVVEIACHGSPIILETALAALLREGARAATPGEFTLRAFLNGRIDLTQAEAVRDLIDAQTLHQARRAQRQLRGELSLRLQPLKERLLNLIVQLESSVEFVEEDIPLESRQALTAELGVAARDLASLSASFEIGRLITEGVSLALAGPPNVGKSSIFNRLLESERAIVTAVPGTTRDLISERLVLDGLPIRFLDTAGIRETEDTVERIGVERTRTAIADADAVLVVLDAEATTPELARSLLEETADFKRIVAVNKVDLCAVPRCAAVLDQDGVGEPVLVSALTGVGIERLRATIVESVAGRVGLERDDILVTNARHHALLVRAADHLDHARRALEDGLSEEFALVGLHASLYDLGELTGETAIDDILHRIFSTFCIGK